MNELETNHQHPTVLPFCVIIFFFFLNNWSLALDWGFALLPVATMCFYFYLSVVYRCFYIAHWKFITLKFKIKVNLFQLS